MVDTILSVVGEVGKWLAAPIGRQFMYLYNYKKNIDNLQAEVRKLTNTKEEVQVKVTAAEKNLEEINQNVKDWQNDVEKTITEADKLIEENPRCFKGLCPNWITRYKHSKKSFKLKQDDIRQLLDRKFNEVSHPTTQKEIWLRPDEDYLAFQSRTSTEKKVWDSLNDENIYMIGVYGMGGLGKTTLVQEVGRKAEKDKLFSDIVFVEVTETPDIKKIQTAIANKLGLKFENEREGESERANKLYSRMEKKKILLILDNIWKELDLKMVGIPSGVDRGRNKILMTTRNIDVLEKMGSTNNFGMSNLNEEEAWSLFKKMIGGVIQTPGLNSLSQDVCKECGGLPIVICTIAKALRNKSHPFDWKVALRELRAPSPTKFIGLLDKEYQKIALSYKYLRDDELKKTFLIFSLFENNTSISYLFRYVLGLDILEGANLTMEDARDRLDKLVRELKDSCLLLEGSRSNQISVHDVVRAVALTIAYTDYHVFTTKNDIEKEWKDKEKLRKCTTIYLPRDNVLHQLWHEELDFANLEFFFMYMNYNSFKIHENLFKKMTKLKVLNLFGMQQSLLPSSIDLLTNLQTLCLNRSSIVDITIIGKLKKLKVLSLQYADIKELPTEMSQLTQLRLLDLSNCWKLKVIAPNLISKLSQLEELYVKTCDHIQWKVEVLEELMDLSQLTSLELYIDDNKLLPKGFFSKELRRYKITVGVWWYIDLRINEDEISRMLKFKFNSTISLEELQGIKNVEILILVADVENRLDELQSNITPLFNEKLIFTKLMILELHKISSRKIWDNQLPTFMSSSYQNLTQLTLKRCKNIKYAFPSSIAKSLMQLQQLEINDCMVLKEIVAKEGANVVVNLVFPNITLLKLEALPELIAFYLERHTSEWPKLKQLEVSNCDKFTSKHMSFQENSEEGELHISKPKSIFLEDKINSDLEKMNLWVVNKHIEWRSRSKTLNIDFDVSSNIPLGLLQRFENLKELYLYLNNYKELFFPNLPNLEVLYVIRCNQLMKLITLSTVKSLVQLKEMSLVGCEMLIEIVGNEGDATLPIVFNNLKKLSLKRLKSLTCFCSGNSSFSFPSLEELIIGDLNIKTFSQGILSTPKLTKINYESWNNIACKWEKMEVENEGNDLNKTIQKAYKKQKADEIAKLFPDLLATIGEMSAK